MSKIDRQNIILIASVGTIIIISTIIGLVLILISKNNQVNQQINSFAECVKAGYPILESYPEQCIANGKTFKNESQTTNPPSSVKQGVRGNIMVRSGNCMPTTAGTPPNCRMNSYSEKTTVKIWQHNDSDGQINLVKEVPGVYQSFEIELSPGRYGITITYGSGDYCNTHDENGLSCPFEVYMDTVTTYNFQINEAVD